MNWLFKQRGHRFIGKINEKRKLAILYLNKEKKKNTEVFLFGIPPNWKILVETKNRKIVSAH